MPSHPPVLLEVDRLERRYGRRSALAGVDLRVDAGETVVVMGPNGSGKTTLLHVIAGLCRPSAGTVHVLGARAGSRAARGTVALVPDEPSGFDELTVAELARLLAVLSHSLPDTATESIRLLGLEALSDVRVGALSRGQRRRAAVAAALAARPRLLLVDEATATLDRDGVALLRHVLRRHADRGGGALIASHDVAFSRAVADRVVLLDEGVVVGGAAGTISPLLAELRGGGRPSTPAEVAAGAVAAR